LITKLQEIQWLNQKKPSDAVSTSYKSQKKKTEQGRKKKEKEEGRGQRGEATKKNKRIQL